MSAKKNLSNLFAQSEETYCKKCDEKLHNRSQKFKEHKRHPFTGDKIASRFCSIKGHEDVSISLLCLNCSKLICSNCEKKEHQSHETVTLNEGMEKVSEKLKNNIAPISEKNKKIVSEIDKKRKELKELEEELLKNQKSIEETQVLIQKKKNS